MILKSFEKLESFISLIQYFPVPLVETSEQSSTWDKMKSFHNETKKISTPFVFIFSFFAPSSTV